tara:strand:- start:16754 stop:17491 length:738 start_codon:yes stop_codon:yes gene_type:complete
MSKIIDIYRSFLDGEEEKRKANTDEEHKGWFRASSAGTCFKKQWFNSNGYEQSELDDRVMRLLRLGTIVHADVENALKSVEATDALEILTEQEIVMPDIKVIGHLDAALLNKDGTGEVTSAEIYDLKTCASYKWRMKFGRNKEAKPSFNYELQIGTYGLGVQAMYEVDEVSLALLWYNKDTSAMREQKIDALQWTSNALEYWETLNEALVDITNPDDMIPGIDFGVPMMDWECRYCGFTKHCKGI